MKQLETTFARSLIKGELPDNWGLYPLGEAIMASEYGLNDPTAADGNVPIVGMREISDGVVSLAGGGKIIGCPGGLVNQMLRAGDILINRTNSPDLVGKCGIVRQNAPSVFASYLVRLSVDCMKADPEYINYWMNSRTADVAVKRISTRAVSQANINPTELLKNCPLPLPPLPEQRKIAEILRTWDEALEKLTSLRAAKLKRHRGLTMALVFGRWQLERFRKTREVTPYRWFELPGSWSCQHVGDLATEISERNGEGDQHEVLSCSKHDGFVRSLEYFKKQVFSADLTGYKKIWRGDFGFPSNHVEEGSIGLQNLTDIGVVSPIYTVFRFNPDKVNAEYAFAVLKTELYRHIFEVSTSASVDRRGSLRWSEFSRLPFPVPPLDEQEAIADVLRTSRRELDALTDEIEALTRQKRGLMQKLLTGEWRVNTTEATEVAQ